MNKKILIVTLFDDYNIGNRLQNYALQKELLLRNMDVYVLNDCDYATQPTIKEKIKVIVQGVLGVIGFKKYQKRYQKFIIDKRKRKANKIFDEKNITNVTNIRRKQAFHTDWNEYDIAIAGSDQIWHKWSEDEFELPFYYLQFMPYRKRFAYAASFGFESIPEKDLKQHEVGMKGMRYISCREQSGCKIVSKITGKETLRVLDPTLLISISEWRKLEQQASDFSKNQENYVFIYFLGDQPEEYRQKITQIMQSENVKNIIDFYNYKDKNISNCGPSDFLYLIDHAKYVFTDSFHCTVFSVIFNKKFTVFRRRQPGFEKMFGRIEDLLASKGKLEHIYGGTSRKATNDFEKLYSNSMQFIDQILENE